MEGEKVCVLCRGTGVVGPPDDQFMCHCPDAKLKEAANAKRTRDAMTPVEVHERYTPDGKYIGTTLLVKGFDS